VRLNQIYWLCLAVPVALLGGALISQYGFGLYPCEMCMWQRWPHMAAIGCAALALILRRQGVGRAFAIMAALAVLVSGAIGAFHAGVEYGWWEGITTCATTAATGGDPMEAIMNAPLVRCDVAPWTLLGISLAGFNFLISGIAGLWLLRALLRTPNYHL
jgi:disulfide bond formation protein DsbB